MENNLTQIKQLANEDEYDDELDALRLAALNSMRKKEIVSQHSNCLTHIVDREREKDRDRDRDRDRERDRERERERERDNEDNKRTKRTNYYSRNLSSHRSNLIVLTNQPQKTVVPDNHLNVNSNQESSEKSEKNRVLPGRFSRIEKDDSESDFSDEDDDEDNGDNVNEKISSEHEHVNSDIESDDKVTNKLNDNLAESELEVAVINGTNDKSSDSQLNKRVSRNNIKSHFIKQHADDYKEEREESKSIKKRKLRSLVVMKN